MSKAKTSYVVSRIDSGLRAQLEEIAEREDRTVSDVVRRMLAVAVKQLEARRRGFKCSAGIRIDSGNYANSRTPSDFES